MSELAQRARKENKARASRLASGDPHQKVDSSSWTPSPDMKNGTQTGERPISPKAYARGGHVRADRKARASGGMTANQYENRNVKSANDEREGEKHVGGYRDGGRARAHKLYGGTMGMSPRPMPGLMQRPMMRADGGKVHKDAAQDRKLIKHFMHGKGCECAKCSGGRVGRAEGGPVKPPGPKPTWMSDIRPAGSNPRYNADAVQKEINKDHRIGKSESARIHRLLKGGYKDGGAVPRGASEEVLQAGARPKGGRIARASGGKAKKGMNVNIIITQPGGAARGAPPVPPPMPAPPPGAGPVGLHQGAPPPPPPGAPAPMGGAPMMRKHGGRTYPIKDGAGGAKGRLQKIAAYG